MLTYKEFRKEIGIKFASASKGNRGLEPDRVSTLNELLQSILEYVQLNKELDKHQTITLMEIGKQMSIVIFSINFDLAVRA